MAAFKSLRDCCAGWGSAWAAAACRSSSQEWGERVQGPGPGRPLLESSLRHLTACVTLGR